MNLFPTTGTAPLLGQTLAACVPELRRRCSDPWAVIGSAAAWLAGADVEVADVDVLTSARDARSLVRHWQGRLLDTAGLKDADRFRSHFARFDFPLPVEVMGDLEVARPEGWRRVHVGATTLVQIDRLSVPIPTLDEQLRLLECFGRPKDRLRAGLLTHLRDAPA
ncbi:hypothetical protein [Frateuria terrea]|uniref:Nucleotidyl transferase AbiEii toxin, Type IV TA system n=1 Tax=Frateuria terrea TaxID=529704 RepID=A0A1H6Z7A9_9GAMM|nr:hypothetical protein [Frateuria terrea]SEJ48596.1 hypothetical protein SAMN04487997_3537 [Frateuria terrea]SFP46323.1 hypothetical protein SAMN02927913_2135 [Frateuria terrea]